MVQHISTFPEQGDENKFDTEKEYVLGKPTIRHEGELDIISTNGKQLAARLNIPFFGLSRDHAGKILITTETILSVIDEFRGKIELARAWNQYDLGEFQYKVVANPSFSQ